MIIVPPTQASGQRPLDEGQDARRLRGREGGGFGYHSRSCWCFPGSHAQESAMLTTSSCGAWVFTMGLRSSPAE